MPKTSFRLYLVVSVAIHFVLSLGLFVQFQSSLSDEPLAGGPEKIMIDILSAPAENQEPSFSTPDTLTTPTLKKTVKKQTQQTLQPSLPSSPGSPQGYGEGRGSNEVLAQIKLKIAKAQYYPENARRMGLEGKIVVSFHLSENGIPQNIQVLTSSGQPLLDQAAIRTIEKASPYPLYEKPLQLQIVYSLK